MFVGGNKSFKGGNKKMSKQEVKGSVVAITIFFDVKTGKVVGKPRVYDAYNRYLGGIIKP